MRLRSLSHNGGKCLPAYLASPHIYIYIRRPLLVGGHQAGRKVVLSHKSVLLISFIDVIFQESFQHSISNCYLMVYRSANWCLMVYRSASWCLVTCYSTPWTDNLPPSRRVPSAWGGSGETLKFIKISSNLQYPKNHQINLPRPPKVIKIRSKQVPEIIKFMKKSRK